MQRVQELFDQLTDDEKNEFINTNKSCLENRSGSSKTLEALKKLISYEMEALNEWICSVAKGHYEYYRFDHVPFYELINGECINNDDVISTLIEFYEELTSDFYQVHDCAREDDQISGFKDMFIKILNHPCINEENQKLVAQVIDEFED